MILPSVLARESEANSYKLPLPVTSYSSPCKFTLSTVGQLSTIETHISQLPTEGKQKEIEGMLMPKQLLETKLQCILQTGKKGGAVNKESFSNQWT